MALTFEHIIDKYRKNSTSERNKGDKFERLMQAYLLTKPTYKNLLSNVWLWADFPYKAQFGTGGKDTGIDIVCRAHDGDYWAVQCKCYQADKKIDKAMVDSFVSTSSFKFQTQDGEKNFSFRIWIDTTYGGFNAEAQNVIEKLGIGRIGLIDLKNDDVNWEELDAGKKGNEARIKKYELLAHQKEAYNDAIQYYKTCDRGKLIMACGTGKTFTSLRIAEDLAVESRLVLFLVPSIALLSQTLKEWSAQSKENIYPICICSDAHASDKAEDSISDLVLPATTDSAKVHRQFVDYRNRLKTEGGMIVVFSTYQSIDVIGTVQKDINRREKDSFLFDLIICDEAHRTTGIKQKDKSQSAFTKVHSNDNINAKKRLYMTATPRLYSSEAQAKAKENETLVWSMDAPEWFGEEIYRIGFGAAVEKQLLSDYKVIVLTLDEHSVSPEVQKSIIDGHSEIKMTDAIKLIGCINVLSKRTSYLTDKELFSDVDPEPMKSAVAFCSSIKNSKYLKDSFNVCRQAYYDKLSETEREQLVVVDADHVDGTMGSTTREEKLDRLKHADPNKNECRILNNVRCLSEGVDVPSLDAIMFLSSRNSQVDVVQSVGRVMRKAEGKKFGYIIIPVIVPADKNANEVLDTSDDFKIVWSVLNALRAHDDRFNATINKIELNKKKPKIITVSGGGNFGGKPVGGNDDEAEAAVQGVLDFDELQQELYEKFKSLTEQVFAKIVNKCGSRRYWADWGKDVSEIAKRNIERIHKLISIEGTHKEKFTSYWEGLKKNLNPSVSQSEAVEMLAQHIITKPVFEALFGNDRFTKENPVSKSLEDIVILLDEKSAPEDLEKLERFYKSVQQRVEGIDNAEGKQKVVVELYDSFFKNAFPLTVEKLGIVYTPVPVVDFIIRSVEWVLNKEFGRSISDERVNVIDPFTGTGTFITRLLQLGIIKQEDLERKYKHEIFANEIVLLAYYIASVNIENAYHDLSGKDTYEPFGGICLTDTFQLYETGEPTLDDRIFRENSDRVNEQRKQPITVVMGNPPYSIGQKSANDNAQNQRYPKLEERIATTYVKESEAGLNKSAYDSYIKAFRWASDRITASMPASGGGGGGIIAFVSNGSFLDNNAQDGFRKTLEKEFERVYVFNLRGNQRTSGELSRREGGKIFGSGSRTPIAITVLVKKETA
ncbi:DEAD/DEAH box helicase [Treponema vincentii]|uniref:restriction endonuclease n=1 Tax=Treponema vincentii TaxID=69710 RepID=UPI003D928AAA